MIRRVPLRNGGLVYELTPYGRALEPILLALGRWGLQAMGDPTEGDVVTPDSLTMMLRASFQPARADDLDVELHVGDIASRVQIRDGALEVIRIAPPAPPVGGAVPEGEPEAVIVAGPRIRRLIAGEVTPAEAIAQDLVAVVHGEEATLDRFAQAFRIAAVA
ncbi:hypothetical protein [Microbacterium sp. S308A+]|uniref:hypothetical protein n=1 Tax=Microbacterium sp. S308A+ TaxID=3415135 RepID=UPI003C7B232D